MGAGTVCLLRDWPNPARRLEPGVCPLLPFPIISPPRSLPEIHPSAGPSLKGLVKPPPNMSPREQRLGKALPSGPSVHMSKVLELA